VSNIGKIKSLTTWAANSGEITLEEAGDEGWKSTLVVFITLLGFSFSSSIGECASNDFSLS
jgi:hypothetical protein